MKSELIKVSNDVACPVSHSPRYKDANEVVLHGVYIRRYKKTEHKLFINNGHLMARYKYPIIERTFISPMLNDFNLHHCGGWFWPGVKEEGIATRVANKEKPMGFICFRADNMEGLAILEKEAQVKGLATKHARSEWGTQELGVSNRGKMGELFDLEHLAEDYSRYYEAIGVKDPGFSWILDWQEKELSELPDYDYANPSGIRELICTGLILGYPVETTVASL